MRVERRTPGYMIREESKGDKLRTRIGKRAMRYEEKLERGEESVWARRCWEEIKKREGRITAEWEEQRKVFYMERGMSAEWVREVRLGGGVVEEELVGKDREVQAQGRMERILSSRWNRWYGEIRTLGFPKYLKKRKGEENNNDCEV